MESDKGVLALTARIVSAHVSNNQVAAAELPSLIQNVRSALATLGQAAEIEATTLTPAVPIKKSVFPGYIVCLEDGKKMKMLKRYLQTRFGMTPDAYRAKWGLPGNHPMTAPNYARLRSELAKSRGLGRKPTTGVDVAEPAQAEVPKVKVLPARRARGVKA